MATATKAPRLCRTEGCGRELPAGRRGPRPAPGNRGLCHACRKAAWERKHRAERTRRRVAAAKAARARARGGKGRRPPPPQRPCVRPGCTRLAPRAWPGVTPKPEHAGVCLACRTADYTRKRRARAPEEERRRERARQARWRRIRKHGFVVEREREWAVAGLAPMPEALARPRRKEAA